MGVFLESLRQAGDCHRIEHFEDGFIIARLDDEHARAFNDLARRVIGSSGTDYVALPRTDGLAGYERVIIIPVT
jgi:hypothetical protein